MTDDAIPDEANGGPDLALFLRDWTELWQEELRLLAAAPETMPAGMLAAMGGGGMTPDLSAATEMWRAAMTAWAPALAAPPLAASPLLMVRPDGRSATPGATPAAAAPHAVDVENERLARRIDELEVRLAKLEHKGRRRG